MKTQGKISSIIRERSIDYPIVTFVTLDGREVVKRYFMGTNISIFTIGEMVEIFYMQNNPEQYIIYNKKYNYIAVTLIIIGALGAIALKML